MLTVVTGGKAAPGATVTAWALTIAWPRPVIVLDCDPAGGDMVAGMLPGRLSQEQGLMTWATATRGNSSARSGASALPKHAVAFEGAPHAWLVPGFSTAMQASAMSEDGWTRLSQALGAAAEVLSRDVIVDTGRLSAVTGWPLLRRADRVLLCVRPSVRSVRAALDGVERIRHECGDTTNVGAVVVGSGPYGVQELVEALEVPVVAELPEDRRAAAAFSDGAAISSRALGRSGLVRAAGGLARRLCEQHGGVGAAAARGIA